MFLICGEALFDLYAESTTTGFQFDARVGGSPFNVAIGLARLGQPAALLAGLSTDFLGERLRTALATEGVSIDQLVEKAAPTTLAFVSAAPDGGPAYAFYGGGAADRGLLEADLPAIGDDVWGLHAGSFSLVADPTGASLLTLFQRERRRRLLSIDPNVRLNVEPNLDIWRSRVAAFAACADVVKISWEDADLLYPGTTAEGLSVLMLDAGARLVVVTFGAEGAAAYTKAHAVRRPGKPLVDPAADADTVGAGDTFQAALLTALRERGVNDPSALSAEDLAAVLDFAASAAAVTCSRRGADLPRRGELPTAT